MKKITLSALFLFALVVSIATYPDEQAADTGDYAVVSQGTRALDGRDGSDFLKVLVEASNLGGDEVEIAEITFPPNYKGNSHPHGSLEIFYVLNGRLTHVVNGQGAQLEPGMIGIVRPGDSVEHINETDEPVKTLVVWVPGGEILRSFGDASMTPIESLPITMFSKD